MVPETLTCDPPALIAIGGSAGAIEVLGELLPQLPGDTPPVAVVLHLPAHSPSLLAQIFTPRCRPTCVEVEDKAPLCRGHIHFGPPGYHLLVASDETFSLSVDEPVHFSRPSIDVFFESAARALGPRVLAVLLTGANDDGANGLAALSRGGATTVVQSPDSARAPALPRAALRRSTPSFVGPPALITTYLVEQVARRGTP